MDKERFTGSVIVAMKGPPCCGKSYIARQIAKDLKYRIIEQDACIEALQSAVKNSTTTTKNLEYLHALSLDIVLQIALKQLQLGHRLVLSSWSAYHKTGMFGDNATRTDIKKKAAFGTGQQRRRIFLWLRHRIRSGLTMTFQASRSWWLTPTHLYKDLEIAMAVKYLASIQASQRMSVHQWDNDIWLNDKSGFWKVGNREGEDAEEEEDEKDDEDFHHHHFVLVNDGNIDDDEITCRGCSEPISSSNSSPPYYKCSGSECSLSLHQACAELLNKEFPILQIYSFPEKYRCNNCEYKDYDECPGCLFETNLRCKILPSVINHNCHQHLLCIKTCPISIAYEYKCKACGDLGKHVSYHCECGFAIHPNCALMPRTIKHKSHRHTLVLTSSPKFSELKEDSCNGCEEERNPNHWFYKCEKCEKRGYKFVCHLYCKISRP
ncbi:hypothetical protein Acr_01g0009300 [Actinidia rufa]|uniref:DC1 domain-containing protein n=1 Tax=Actinidia rufa TaxID=165716 RepID=A0A7J0E3N0_9ERIC|nr:hypothetical protein Acr_01g0009300 [Actinidia rufa]